MTPTKIFHPHHPPSASPTYLMYGPLSGHQDDEPLFTDEGLTVNREDFNELIILMSELDSDFKEYMLSPIHVILISIPFVDCLLQQLHDRFQRKTKNCIKGIFLIPNNLENINAEVKKIKEACSNDLPSPSEFDQQINLWKRFWSSENSEVITIIT